VYVVGYVMVGVRVFGYIEVLLARRSWVCHELSIWNTGRNQEFNLNGNTNFSSRANSGIPRLIEVGDGSVSISISRSGNSGHLLVQDDIDGKTLYCG